MLCSCVIFNNICQRSSTDLEKFLPSGKCSVTIGKTVLELYAFGVLWRRVCHRSGGGFWKCFV